MLRLKIAVLVVAALFASAVGVASAEEGEKAPPSEKSLRNAIKNLSTSGWREAHEELLNGGKAAVPILIEAMGAPVNEQTTVSPAYNLGGHTKADAGRATRQLTIAEVCRELLTTMITTRSNYKGELPGLDQKAWQEWWNANADTITIGSAS